MTEPTTKEALDCLHVYEEARRATRALPSEEDALNMTELRDALQAVVRKPGNGVGPRLGYVLDLLAPHIERALRAAYAEGAKECELLGFAGDCSGSHGVAAGVAALKEDG